MNDNLRLEAKLIELLFNKIIKLISICNPLIHLIDNRSLSTIHEIFRQHQLHTRPFQSN